jgi:hypothetical protein
MVDSGRRRNPANRRPHRMGDRDSYLRDPPPNHWRAKTVRVIPKERCAIFGDRNRLRVREAVRGPSSLRVAQVVRMTQKREAVRRPEAISCRSRCSLCQDDTRRSLCSPNRRATEIRSLALCGSGGGSRAIGRGIFGPSLRWLSGSELYLPACRRCGRRFVVGGSPQKSLLRG